MPIYAANSSINPGFQKIYENNGNMQLDSKIQTSAMTNINDRTMTVSNKALDYNYENQSMSKLKGMGYIGGMVDTANGISRTAQEAQLPNFNNVKKMTLAY